MNKSEQMSRVRARDTAPEISVRSALSRLGVRYRLHRKDLPGKPDLYIGRLRLAIFVNGCFWHGHDCPRGSLPKTNLDFWKAKIAQNVARDEQTRAELGKRGIDCLELWTCRHADFSHQCKLVARRYVRALCK